MKNFFAHIFLPQRKPFFVLERIGFSRDEWMISSFEFDIKLLVCLRTKKLETVKRVESDVKAEDIKESWTSEKEGAEAIKKN